jgi:Predicted membrane protein
MKKLIGLRTLKTAIGAAIAIVISEALGLRYAVSAGVITVLSVQNTKKHSITLAFQRLGSTLLALLISAILFSIVGYNPVAFGMFLLIFIPLAVKFKMQDGIVVSSVLVTHLLVENSISFFWIKNELLLMTIGAGIAILLNTYMPKVEEKIKSDQKEIEGFMKEILISMAKSLRDQSVSISEEKLFNQLEEKLKEATERAYINLNNNILYEAKYYVKYMQMRTVQLQVLKYMRGHFTKFYIAYDQTELVASFTERVALALHEYNTAETLLQDLKEVLRVCSEQELPKSREEFENRAMLFQYLNDLEYMLEIKRDFKRDLDNK